MKMLGITNLQILNDAEGRFGNQLFRIGTMIAQSYEKGIPFLIPNEWKHLNVFPNLKDHAHDYHDISFKITASHHESCFGYHNIPSTSGILNITGYFQSWLFLKNYEQQVKKHMAVDNEIISRVKKRLPSDGEKLCIHIRWGDPYDRSVGGGHKGIEDRHPVMSIEYYERSIDYILSKRKIDEFVIFTDNNDTKEYIEGKFDRYGVKTTYFDYSDNYIDDFVAQTLCDHFIIANSTFSWWSAFLGGNENSIVCSPTENEWFGPTYSHFSTRGLLPNYWVQITQK
jgi:hypothetical protein